MNYKTCSRCKKKLFATPEYFRRDKSKRDGLRSECKECSSKAVKRWKDKNKEHIKEYNKEYRKKNGDYDKRYYKKNKDVILKKNKKFFEKFKEEKGIDYKHLHYIIKCKKVKPLKCEICKKEKPLELSSINHSYTENPDDYQYLCVSCHRDYDSKLY